MFVYFLLEPQPLEGFRPNLEGTFPYRGRWYEAMVLGVGSRGQPLGAQMLMSLSPASKRKVCKIKVVAHPQLSGDKQSLEFKVAPGTHKIGFPSLCTPEQSLEKQNCRKC